MGQSIQRPPFPVVQAAIPLCKSLPLCKAQNVSLLGAEAFYNILPSPPWATRHSRTQHPALMTQHFSSELLVVGCSWSVANCEGQRTTDQGRNGVVSEAPHPRVSVAGCTMPATSPDRPLPVSGRSRDGSLAPKPAADLAWSAASGPVDLHPAPTVTRQ